MERRDGEAEEFGICSKEAFIIGLIPLLAKTFKLNVSKLLVHPNKPKANPSSSAAPCGCLQKLTCAAADDDSSEQTDELRLERIAAVAG